MKAVAEGIQSKKQVQILKEQLACDAIQGYYYSRPLPNDEYVIFIKKNRFERKSF
jgi:EAL domain-containing protein (putative c-di-GMP-specific phosphodiesterase class I)